MKFWKKIFSYSVILFVILLNLAGMIIVEKTFDENLKDTISHAVGTCSDLENSLYLNADYLLNVDATNIESIKEWVDIIVRGYVLNMKRKRFNIELYTEQNENILTDWGDELTGDRPELSVKQQSDRKFIIRTVNGKRYVFISSIVVIKNTKLKLVLSSDIEHVYQKRKVDHEYFLVLSLCISIVLAFGMYVISIGLTRSLGRLSEGANNIAKGEYGTRVAERGGKDEIDILSSNFNKMAEVIEDKIYELHEHNEAKQRFIDSLNHEIKTPITSIIGYSDLLLRSKVDEKTTNQALMYINSEARRLSILNQTLIELTLLREEETKRDWVSITACITNASNALKYKMQQTENNLFVDVEEVRVLANRNQLEVMFTNLLDNASKASTDGGKIEILGKLDETTKEYHLVIKDYGIGIEKEEIDKIAEPFYMVDKVRTRKANGFGLGLSICSEICEANEITMSFESALGEGTAVTVKFGKENITK